MPYIDGRDRLRYDLAIAAIANNPGELNFQITTLILRYLRNKGECYENFNAVLGVLSAVGHELYRRKVAPYEDEKIEENGDVY